MRAAPRPWIPALLSCLLLAPSAPAVVIVIDDDRARIAERLANEGPQDILVEVETTDDDAILAGKLEVQYRRCIAEGGVPVCASLVVRNYGRIKQRAFCGLPGVSLLQDYEHIATSFLRVATLAAFYELLARPDVALVHENGLSQPFGARGATPPSFSCAFAPAQAGATWLWGDWDGDGAEEVGKYVPALDAFLLDANGDGLWQGIAGGDRNVAVAAGLGPGEPLVGDWNGDGADGVGKRVDARVLLDANENGRWDGVAGGDRNAPFAPGTMRGQPLVGDWNGDGADDFGIYQPFSRFLLDLDGDGVWRGVAGGDRQTPVPDSLPCPTRAVAADWDPELPGESVGVVQGRRVLGDVGYALDLDEDGSLSGDFIVSPPQPALHCLIMASPLSVPLH